MAKTNRKQTTGDVGLFCFDGHIVNTCTCNSRMLFTRLGPIPQFAGKHFLLNSTLVTKNNECKFQHLPGILDLQKLASVLAIGMIGTCLAFKRAL